MTKTYTVTSKSMGTIPAHIRRKCGIKEGSKLQFVDHDGAIILVPLRRLAEMHGMDKTYAKVLMEGIRELAREHRSEVRK